MTDSDETVLRGLPGDNPLGFLAALGVQVALAVQGDEHTLHWTDEPIPHPVVAPSIGPDQIARSAVGVAQGWLSGPVLSTSISQTLKMDAEEVRDYLKRCRGHGRNGVLALCLIAEGSRYSSGNALGKSKPTDFYFTAARQQFLTMARERLRSTSEEQIVSDLVAPWEYRCNDNNSLMWDLISDRHHAHSSADPTDNTLNPKVTNAGAEAVAILGLRLFPCFGSDGSILTTAIHGSGRNKRFLWPLWTVPASSRAVSSLVTHVAPSSDDRSRVDWYHGWGISLVMESQIRSRGQGFGTFGPPKVVWQRD